MLRDEREQGRSPEPVKQHSIDVFNKDSYGRVIRLVKKLGPVRSYGEIRAAFVSQTPSLLGEMRDEDLEHLKRQATRLGGDAIFLNRPDVREGIVTRMIDWEGFAVRYNPRVDYERIMCRLRSKPR